MMNKRCMLILLGIFTVITSCDDSTLQQKIAQLQKEIKQEKQTPSQELNATKNLTHVQISALEYRSLQQAAARRQRQNIPSKHTQKISTTYISIPIKTYENLLKLSGITLHFSFERKEDFVAYKNGVMYKQKVVQHLLGGSYYVKKSEKHFDPVITNRYMAFTDDERAINWSSSDDTIATVDADGWVSAVTVGTVIITAYKEETVQYPAVRNSYTLYITTKPREKSVLAEEIQRAIEEHGEMVDLNYIDTSAITDMSYLFADGNGLETFNGDISKWNVSKVKNFVFMFYGSAFEGNINGWRVYSYGKNKNIVGNIHFWRANAYARNIYMMFKNSGISRTRKLPIWCIRGTMCIIRTGY